MSTEERLPGGPAWHDFCSRLERAGDELAERTDDISTVERSEGVPYLLGLVSSAIQIATRFADPDRPHFIRNPDSVTRWGSETADCLYLFAGIRGAGSYVVRGRRNNVEGFFVEVKEGYMQLGETRIFATLSDDELKYDEDGTFAGRLNTEMVDLEVPDDDDIEWLQDRIQRHLDETDSAVASRILGAWPVESGRFRKVMPRDYKRVLEARARAEIRGEDPVAAVMAAAHG